MLRTSHPAMTAPNTSRPSLSTQSPNGPCLARRLDHRTLRLSTPSGMPPSRGKDWPRSVPAVEHTAVKRAVDPSRPERELTVNRPPSVGHFPRSIRVHRGDGQIRRELTVKIGEPSDSEVGAENIGANLMVEVALTAERIGHQGLAIRDAI
ncbi:MAG: hypothetical protein ACK4WH_14145, partial [Phycisphaerales bacterium]